MTNKKRVIYELLINDISIIIKEEIDESFNNYVLLEYNIDRIFNTLMLNESTDTNTLKALKLLKKLLATIIEKLQKTNQYKKAEKISTEFKKRVTDYIDEHKQITPKRMFKIIVTVLSIYGGVSMYQDCKSLIYDILNTIEQTQDVLDNEIIYNEENPKDDFEDPEDFVVDVDRTGLNKSSTNKDKINNVSNLLPTQVYKKDKDFKFTSSDNARDFIKKHEHLLLYPYYATEKEERQGKVTIGYGHVVLKSDGALYTKVLELKKKGLITRSYIYNKKTKKYILNPTHCKDIITEKDAHNLFLNDIEIAEKRAFNTILNMDTDEDVKYYMLYNQDIKDGITSLCYNAGELKQNKYSFIKNGISKCRYDEKNKCINAGDYNLSFKMFKNIKDNPKRRAEEYKLFFVNANKPLNINI